MPTGIKREIWSPFPLFSFVNLLTWPPFLTDLVLWCLDRDCTDTVGCDITATGSVWGFQPMQPKGVSSPLYRNTELMHFRCLLSSQAEIPSISVFALVNYGYCVVLPYCLLYFKTYYAGDLLPCALNPAIDWFFLQLFAFI